MSAWENNGKSDEWYTPAYIFDALGVYFDVDVAAPKEGPRHVPCASYISERSLEKDWNGLVWMNPPFGGRNGVVPWMDKFFEHKKGIALCPDRTSAPWFQKYASMADAIVFISPKVKFERPDGTLGKSPGTGTALLASGEQSRLILARGGRKLGMMVQNYAFS